MCVVECVRCVCFSACFPGHPSAGMVRQRLAAVAVAVAVAVLCAAAGVQAVSLPRSNAASAPLLLSQDKSVSATRADQHQQVQQLPQGGLAASSSLVRMSERIGGALARFEGARTAAPNEPCGEPRSASLAFVLSIVCPPAAYYYYVRAPRALPPCHLVSLPSCFSASIMCCASPAVRCVALCSTRQDYVTLGTVQLLLYLAFLVPACWVCCVCAADPPWLDPDCIGPSADSPTAASEHDALLEPAGTGAVKVRIPSSSHHLHKDAPLNSSVGLLQRVLDCRIGFVLLFAAVVLLGLALLTWQVANVVRIGVGSLQPHDGCRADMMTEAF